MSDSYGDATDGTADAESTADLAYARACTLLETEPGPDAEREAEAILRDLTAGADTGLAAAAAVQLSVLLLDRGEDDEVDRLLSLAAEAGHPDHSVRALGMLAERYAERDESEAAIEAFAGVADSGHPELAGRAAFNLAMVLDRQGRTGEAAAALQRAASDRDPQVAMAAKSALMVLAAQASRADQQSEPDPDPLGAALAGLSSGGVESVRSELRRLSAQDDGFAGLEATVLGLVLDGPTGADHPVLRAAVQRHAGETDAARAGFRASTGADPDTAALAHALLGRLLVDVDGDQDGAAAAYRQALQYRRPISAGLAGYLLAEAGGASGREDVEALRQALRDAHPATVPWLAVELGELLTAGGDAQGAAASLRRAVLADHEQLAVRAFSALSDLETDTDIDTDDERQVALLRLGAASRQTGLARRSSFLLGCELVDRQDWGPAVAAFDRAAGSEELLDCAGFAAALIRRDLDAARTAFAGVAAHGPGDNRLQFACRAGIKIAHHHQSRQDPSAAGLALELVADAGPDDLAQQAALFLGVLRRDSGDPDGALAALDRAAGGQDPDVALMACFTAARIRHDRGDLEEAADGYRQVMACGEPERSSEAARLLGRLLIAQGDVDAARELFAERSGSPEAAAVDLGTSLRELGRTEPAIEAFTEAKASTDPDILGYAGLALAGLYGERGDEDRAEAELRRVIEVGDADAAGDALYNLGQLLADRGDREDALAALRQAAGSGGGEMAAQAMLRVAELLAAGGDLPAAMTALAVSADTSDVEDEDVVDAAAAVHEYGPLALSRALARRGDLETARAVLAGAYSESTAALCLAAVQHDLPSLRAGLLRLPAQGSDHEQASELVFSIAGGIAADPDEAGGATELLELLAAAGHTRRAGHALVTLAALTHDRDRIEECCLRAFEVGDPDTAGAALFNLGKYREGWGDLPGAVAAHRQAVAAADPEAAGRARRSLADLLAASGDLPGAAAVLARPDPRDESGRIALAEQIRLLTDAGEWEVASAFCRSAVKSDIPDQAMVGALHLADFAEQEGDHAGTMRWYRRAAELARLVGEQPTELATRYRLARDLYQHGDLAEAATEAESLLGVDDPQYVAQAQILLGAIRSVQGDRAGASELVAAAATAGAGAELTGLALRNLEAVAAEQRSDGDHHGAVQTLQRLARAGNPQQAGELAHDYSQDTDADLACRRRYLDLAVENAAAGTAALAGIALGELLSELHDLAGAQAAFQRAYQLPAEPDLTSAAGFKLYELLDRRGLTEPAEQLLAELASGPDGESGMAGMLAVVRGISARDRGDLGEAESILRAAAAGGGTEGAALAAYVLGQSQRKQGDLAAARQAYQQVIDSGHPQYGPQAMNELGAMAYAEEDHETAARWWLDAARAGDSDAAVRAAMNLGLLAKSRRDRPEAERWYRTAVDSGDPQHAPLAAAHLGELCYWLEDMAAAADWYRRTLADSDDPELVAEAGYRVGEISVLAGDRAAARPALERAAGSGDPRFEPIAGELLRALRVPVPAPASGGTGAAEPDAVKTNLEAAGRLLPDGMADRAGEADELATCASLGYHHLRMETLIRIGRFAEREESAPLPPAFWLHLALAAKRMDFPEFVPFLHGKSLRRPDRDHYDMAVAMVRLPELLGPGWRRRYPDLFAGLDKVAAAVRALGPELDRAVRRGEDQALAGYLREGKLLTAKGWKRRKSLTDWITELFDDLFDLVNQPDFGAELEDLAWAVVCPNWFEVRLSDGLLPISQAAVWWR